MFIQRSTTGLIAILLAVVCVSMADVRMVDAQECECEKCGEEVECKKVCCLKCYEREVEFTCYKSEFEDFCVPCPSTKCGERCVSGCLCTDGADGCGRKKVFGVWKASGAEVKTRRRLMRKTMVKRVPDFRWEVQSRCVKCCNGCMQIQSGTTMPQGVPALPVGVELIDISQMHSVLNRRAAGPPAAQVAGQPAVQIVELPAAQVAMKQAAGAVSKAEPVDVPVQVVSIPQDAAVNESSPLSRMTRSTDLLANAASKQAVPQAQATAAVVAAPPKKQVTRVVSNKTTSVRKRPVVHVARKPELGSVVVPAERSSVSR